MLSEIQREDIISRAIKAFEGQFGVKRQVSDMELSIDKPNTNHLCSIFITSKTDDFKIKLNLTSMNVTTSLTAFRQTQLQNYGPGMEDEVVVADLTLAKRDYVAFFNYLKSSKFKEEVIDDADPVVDDDNIRILTEEGYLSILEDEF